MSAELEFREAPLQEIWRDSKPGKPMPDELASGQLRSWECVCDSQVVGHCVGNSATGEILGLAVQPAYRRQGIGTTLLALVVNWLRSASTVRIWLAAPADPALPAYGFYRAAGWVPTGERRGEDSEILHAPATDRRENRS